MEVRSVPLLWLALTLALGIEVRADVQSDTACVPHEVLVVWRDTAAASARQQCLARAGLCFERSGYGGAFDVLAIPDGCSPSACARLLAGDDAVATAEPNWKTHLCQAPNDPYYRYQWDLFDTGFGIRCPAAWKLSTGAGVIVAVVDTGVAYTDAGTYRRAPDLAQTRFAPGYDFIDNHTTPIDKNGHGTHVAGTIAQSTNNGIGGAGVAYDATVLPVRVMNQDGDGTIEQLSNGIRFAADRGARVINISLGALESSVVLQAALQYAASRDAVIVAAAGNLGLWGIEFPARYPECIAVGAVRFDGQRPTYSGYGARLDVVAPGGDIYVDQNGDGFPDGILQETFDPARPNEFAEFFFQGTSMAAAHVSGIAALIRAAHPEYTREQVRSVLTRSATDLGARGWDPETGFGLVNAAAALATTPGSTSPNPPSPPDPPSPPPPPPPPPPAPVHDVAVTSLAAPAPVPTNVESAVSVVVANRGEADDPVTVTLLDGDTAIGTQMRTIGAGKSETIAFVWNPGRKEGARTLSARATLPTGIEDKNPGDNSRSLDVRVLRPKSTMTVTSDKQVYRLAEFVTLKHLLLDGDGYPIGDQNIEINITYPRGETWVPGTTTNASGIGAFRFFLYPTRSSGIYRIRSTIYYPDGTTVNATCEFQVIP